MRSRIAAVAAGVFALALLITGCSTAAAPTAPDAAQGERVGSVSALADLDAREVIAELDTTALADRPEGLQASIRPDELVMVDASGDDLVMPMPEDEVYIAFAPYATQTHDCTFHAPNSCVGELQRAAITISITDSTSGEVYVDEQTTTYDNGFIGFWLPRDIDAAVTVTAEGRTGTVDITTRGADVPTCITTLRIA